MTSSIFPDVATMTPVELAAEHQRVQARVDSRYGRQGLHCADSNRELIDEARLDELAAELDRRARGGKRRRSAA